MMLSRMFGEPSHFAIEVQHSPTKSGPHKIVGLYFYWIKGTRIGRDEYPDLSNTLVDMRDANVQKPGHRAGGSFCALSPADFMLWWRHWWEQHQEESPDDPGPVWHDDYRRLSLTFDSFNFMADHIFLLDCGGVGRLMWYADKYSQATVIEDDIGYFENILGDVYNYMSGIQEWPGYKHYLTDQPYRVRYTMGDPVWTSALIRMKRMVEPQGHDAVIDHLFLLRAPSTASRDRVSEIARSMEQEESGEGPFRWRDDGDPDPDAEGYYEILMVALDGADFDGMEVFAYLPVTSPELLVRFPAGAAFHPERSTPRRKRPMTLNLQDAAGDGPPWFSVRLRMAVMIEGQGCSELIDYVHLLRAADFDAAFDRAIAIGRSKERDRPCYDHPRILFRFVEVEALNLLGGDALGDTIELCVDARPWAG